MTPETMGLLLAACACSAMVAVGCCWAATDSEDALEASVFAVLGLGIMALLTVAVLGMAQGVTP